MGHMADSAYKLHSNAKTDGVSMLTIRNAVRRAPCAVVGERVEIILACWESTTSDDLPGDIYIYTDQIVRDLKQKTNLLCSSAVAQAGCDDCTNDMQVPIAQVYNCHKLTTRVSSSRNCRRYFAISTAMPLGSLMLLVRSSFSTPRKPSFHFCLSSSVFPGFAVPSWTSSFSPTMCKVSLRKMAG